MSTSDALNNMRPSPVYRGSNVERNNWTTDVEQRFQAQGEEAMGYQWILTHWVRYLWFGNQVWFWLTVIIQTLVTILSSIFAILANNNAYQALAIVVAVLSGIAEAMTIAGQFYNFDDLINQCENAQIDFSKHANNITSVLSFRRMYRTDALVQSDKWDTAWDNLLDNTKQLKIPQFIINKYRKKFAKSPIKRPNIAGDIEKINIVVENPADTPSNRSSPQTPEKPYESSADDEDAAMPPLQKELNAAMHVADPHDAELNRQITTQLSRLISEARASGIVNGNIPVQSRIPPSSANMTMNTVSLRIPTNPNLINRTNTNLSSTDFIPYAAGRRNSL